MYRPLALTLAALALPAAPAAAGVIYSQPADIPTAPGFFARTSSYATGVASVYQSYDNFVLPAAATVTGLTWQGLSFDVFTGGATAVPVTAFNVGFYADAGGQPGAQLYAQTIGFTQTFAGTVDLFDNGEPDAVYDYAGAVPGGFTAAANTPYWLSVQGVTELPAVWTWTSSFYGPVGDGWMYQDANPLTGDPPRSRINTDMAFALAGTPVPEPATLAIFGGLAAGAGGVRRRWATTRE